MSKFESSSSEDDWGDDYSSSEDSSAGTYGKQATQSTTDTLYDNIPKEEMGDEAPISYQTARFHFNVTWTAAELVDANGKLKYEGKIPMSVMNHKLVLEDHNPADFKSLMEAMSQTTALDAKKGKHHKKHKKERRMHQHRDLTKAARLVDVTTNWQGDLGIELPGVNRLGTEGCYNSSASPIVSKIFAAGTFNATTPTTKKVLDRRVTKGMVVFNNQYGGKTWETYKDEFEQLKSGTLIPFDSPWRMYHNQKYAQTPLTKPSENYGTRKVLEVKKELEAEISAIAERDMKSKLSLGDVTHNFAATLFVPMQTGGRVKAHSEFLASGKGEQWKNFYDEYAALSLELATASKSQAEKLIADFHKKPFFARGFLEVDYVHCKGQKIPMNTKKNL